MKWKKERLGEKTGFGAVGNGFQAFYVFKWNCFLPFLFFILFLFSSGTLC